MKVTAVSEAANTVAAMAQGSGRSTALQSTRLRHQRRDMHVSTGARWVGGRGVVVAYPRMVGAFQRKIQYRYCAIFLAVKCCPY